MVKKESEPNLLFIESRLGINVVESILGLMNAMNPGNMEELLKKIGEFFLKLINAERVMIFLIDKKKDYRSSASYIHYTLYPNPPEIDLKTFPINQFSATALKTVVDTKHILFIKNIKEEPKYNETTIAKSVERLSVICCYCGESDDFPIVLYLDSQKKQPFKKEDIEVIKFFIEKFQGVLKKAFAFCPKDISCLDKIIGESEKIKDIKQKIIKVACHDSTVLIDGETGSGKALVAEAIHELSSRRSKPFVTIDMGQQCNRGTAESEIFGHEKGAFTSCISDQKGSIERAEGGTLFLDEIENLTLDMQKSLLNFIQTKKYTRVGDPQPRTANVRIITATNESPEKLAAEKKLREDLYYRINVARINVPPLRERKGDIPLLVKHFLKKISKEQKEQKEFTFDYNFLQSLQWKGNIRQLENFMTSIYMGPDNKIIGKEEWLTQYPEIKSLETSYQEINKKECGPREENRETINIQGIDELWNYFLDACDKNQKNKIMKKKIMQEAFEKLGVEKSTFYARYNEYKKRKEE